MYDAVQIAQHFVQSIIYYQAFLQNFSKFLFPAENQAITVKTEPRRVKTAEIRLISPRYRSISHNFSV